jgi:hypothetical protein
MPSEQTFKFTRDYHIVLERVREPWRASQFLSLSPIYFDTKDELSAKIASYKQRPRNKNRREFEEPKDNSQANRGYVLAGTNAEHYRAYFEQQRVLYRLLTRDLKPGKVALAPPPWLGSGVRVVSLVFGEWSVDNRRRIERLNDPRLVDAGWTDVMCPSFFEQFTGTTVHLKLKSLIKISNPGSKIPHFSNVVEDDQPGLYRRLRELLSHDAKQSGVPLIVLVHDEDMARGIISRAGIDLASWSSGLTSLLPIVAPQKDRRKAEDPSSLALLPGTSIVDMRHLVKAVMETTPGHTVPHSAKVLNMQTDTKTCAGDDSLLLLRMWTSMAQGLAIDEQRKQRASHLPTCAEVLAPLAPAQQAGTDVDPNDMDPNDADPNDMPPGPRPTTADDFSSDDEW